MKKISLAKILKAISAAIDLVSNTVVSHHKKVTYLTYKIAKEMNVAEQDLKNLVMAALIHDIGVFYISGVDLHDYSFDDPDNAHALIGYYLLNESALLQGISPIIKYHHVAWNKFPDDIPDIYSILCLADQVGFLSEKYDIYYESGEIARIVEEASGTLFWPEAVDAFLSLLSKEYFALDLKSSAAINRELDNAILQYKDLVDVDKILDISKVVSYIIDFRSPFTVTHSIGVGRVAREMARLTGFSGEEQQLMEIAAYFHDIGKLTVAPEILNKPGKLTRDEWRVMRAHSYYTYQVLSHIDDLPELKEWAAYHHEKLDGTGYPFQLKADELSTGARIMAVADIFTAITEDRPYRKGMNKKQVIEILTEQVEDNKLDRDIVAVLLDNYDHINRLRMKSQLMSMNDYQDFRLVALSQSG